tara:strand:+ start:204 stop:692 length:489 start_codon:yes stop_codon:yes gene_type:complete
MKIHDLQPQPGANRPPKRVARGIGGKGGKTAGRGTKGQRARGTVPVGFEGGQNPLHLRLPKLRGFNNPFRVEYQAINIDTLDALGEAEITPELLREKGLLRKKSLLKILGRGEVNSKLEVSAHAFSKSAEEAIQTAGGTITVIPKPWGDRRPPAQGNALTNR